MAVSSDNTRITITVNKKIKKDLDILARKRKCSISRLCSNIIIDFFSKNN